MKNYDVCIVGCGPCGIIAALNLSKEYKVCIMESGREYEQRICQLDLNEKCYENCNPCNVISGFGGCQFLDGTKACFYPAGSGLLNFVSQKKLIEYFNYIEKILNYYGKPKREYADIKQINKIKKSALKVNIDVKYYNAQKIDKEIMNDIGRKIKKDLEDNGVDIFYEKEVINIEHNEDYIINTNGLIISAKKVILSPGRLGKLFLNNIANKLNIDYEQNKCLGEIGIIIEMPYSIFSTVDNVYNDIKLKRKIDEHNEIRTFCQNYKGQIRKCVFSTSYGKFSALDGSIMGEKSNTKSVNIAIHHRIKNIKDIKKFTDIICKINKDGKPIVQSMDSFLNNNDDNSLNVEYLTLKDYKIDNINNYLPENTLKYIKKMILDIDKFIPGFANKDNIVYAPSFEFGCDTYKLTKSFETNIKGLYIGGDACGYFRGLMQSMISGKIISDDLLNKKIKEKKYE